MPAGPTRVTKRSSTASLLTASRSASRPVIGEVSAGRWLTTMRRTRSAWWPNTVEGWVLEQDLLLQSPKRWAWLESELFDERFTNTRVCG